MLYPKLGPIFKTPAFPNVKESVETALYLSPLRPELPLVPEEPEVPLDPEVPLEPEVPLDPFDPDVPLDPFNPDVPLEPLDPLDPEVPLDPLIPEVPEEPDEPAGPAGPSETGITTSLDGAVTLTVFEGSGFIITMSAILFSYFWCYSYFSF